MQTFIKLLSLTGILVVLFACSGSKTGGTDSAVIVGDQQTREQIENLLDQIKDNPNTMDYRRQLATVYHENGSNLEAMKTLESALAMDPNDSETKYLYGEVALSAGDKLRAYQSFKAVLQGIDGENYLDRIAPKFTDAFEVTPVINSSAQEAFGSFSVDGSKIIYQTDESGNWDIYEYDIATQMSRMRIGSLSQEENPSFSPDGKKIIYTSTTEDHRDVEFAQKIRDIFVKDIETGRETNLTTNGSDDWHPKYSVDGKYITFVSERNDLRDVPFYQLFGNIFVMESDGRFQLELAHAEANNGSPCVAPGSTEDKGTIYFDSNRNGKKAIYKTDFKGQEVRQITFNPQSDDLGPDVSPNGDKIVFFSDRDGNYEIYLMNDDGSSQQKLTSNASDDLNPVFSPDGQKILFHSNRSGNFDIYSLDLSSQTDALSLSEVISKIDQALQAVQ